VTLRCKLDGFLLRGHVSLRAAALVAHDGDESFLMDALEALYYEVVSATSEELLWLEQAHYRLLHRAADFRFARTDAKDGVSERAPIPETEPLEGAGGACYKPQDH
jgi:hypothetical protein